MPVGRHGTVGRQAQVGEKQRRIAIGGGNRIGLRPDDESAGHAGVNLLGGAAMRMRMIPIGAGASLRQREFVDALGPRRHGVHRIAVLIRRYGQTVPMHGGFLALELIGEMNADAVALKNLDQRAGAQAVIGEDWCVEPFDELGL